MFLKHQATQEIRFSANILLFMRQYYLLSQAGTPDASAEQRESENGGLKRELEVLKPELQLVRAEVSSATLVLRSSVRQLRCHLCLRLRLSGV